MQTQNRTHPNRPSEKSLRKARNRLSAKIASEKMAGIPKMDSTEAVTDPVITPFLMAMEDEGFVTQKEDSQALKIDRCPRCQQSSRFAFTGNTGEFKLCAVCHN